MTGIHADEIARTLIDIQCEIYRRHDADSAPVDEREYDAWVSEATDMAFQLYGNADMDRYGMEFGKAYQMATSMNAHIAAEGLERALRPDEECPQEQDDEDDIGLYDEICYEMTILGQDRASLAHVIAERIQNAINTIGAMLCEEGRTLDKDHVELTGKSGLVICGIAGMDVPGIGEFEGQPESPFSLIHEFNADGDVLSVLWNERAIAISSCSGAVTSMSEAELRAEFMP